MKPLTVLLGIIAGSALALAVALGMTGVVFLVLLPEYSSRLAPEQVPLLKGLAWSWSLSLAAGASFVGEVRSTQWRRWAQLLLLTILALLAWRFWPV